MNISSIRNPWLRRTLIAVVVPIAFVLELFLRAYDAAKDMAADVRDAW